MTETQELKACWCCNAPAILERASDHHGEWFNLGCSRHWDAVPDRALACPAGRIWYTADPSEMEAAITAWNTRPREAALEAEVAALGAQVRSAAEAAQVVWSGEHARLEAALRPFLALARALGPVIDGPQDVLMRGRARPRRV